MLTCCAIPRPLHCVMILIVLCVYLWVTCGLFIVCTSISYFSKPTTMLVIRASRKKTALLSSRELGYIPVELYNAKLKRRCFRVVRVCDLFSRALSDITGFTDAVRKENASSVGRYESVHFAASNHLFPLCNIPTLSLVRVKARMPIVQVKLEGTFQHCSRAGISSISDEERGGHVWVLVPKHKVKLNWPLIGAAVTLSRGPLCLK